MPWRTNPSKSKTSSASKSSKSSSSGSALKNSKFLANVKSSKVKVNKVKIKINPKEVSKSHAKEKSSSGKSESSKKASRSVSVSSKTSSSSSKSGGKQFKSAKRDSRMYRCVESYHEQEGAQKIVDFYALMGEPPTIVHKSELLDTVIYVPFNMAAADTGQASSPSPSAAPVATSSPPPPTSQPPTTSMAKLSAGMSLIAPTYCGSNIRALQMRGPDRPESSAGADSILAAPQLQAQDDHSE
ncbi:hypothetical protein TYRP_012512 [Tyrophagus putrescentiae]|nr:hypothetical protein TYRP_012512 [Tyrophagus putrescentiae]